MAYQIKCDGLVLYDPRDDELIVDSPKVNLEVNTIGEGSFTIYENHPYYGDLKKLKSVFEVSDEIGVIFRGRMTNNSYDFHNSKFVDLEGAMGYFNDSIVRPYAFPDDWENDSGYITAANSGNVIAFFLNWLIEQHNEQVQEFQRFKLGNVTVTDPNNYLSRSDSNYPKTWDVLKSKLFNSALGGYLCIRYEADGNYIDYLADFELTNTQEIVFGENLLDLKSDSDATETYSAVIPIGAKVETDSGEKVLTIADLPDGLISGDYYKKGDAIYSKSAVAAYGWVCAPVSATTWDDVTDAANLRTKGVEWLANDGVMLSESVEVKAVDQHFTDAQVQSFRIYRKVKVRSDVHGYNGVYQLPRLALDLQNPQNTVITVGATRKTLTEQNEAQKNEAGQQIESVRDELADLVGKTDALEHKIEGIDGTFFYIRYSEYADGHIMTTSPTETTLYMGTCSTSSETAPTDYREYTWCKVRGDDGRDGTPGANGSSQYFHVKYSNDGKTFTSNNGETLGDWIGTCVNTTEADPTTFSAYTWKKIVGEDGKDGIDGVDGTDGKSSYFFVKFSANANGNPMTEAPTSTTKYMGVCSTTSATAPTSYSAYKWTQCRGEDGTNGTPGEPGEDGRTQYLHIKYSDDGETFTANNGEELGAYIGTLVDFNKDDSLVFSDYTWKKFTEDVDEELEDIRQTIVDQSTSILKTSEEVTMTALKSYVQTSEFETYKETNAANLSVTEKGINARFEKVEQSVQDVNGDLQTKYNDIKKHISFDDDGLTLRAELNGQASPNTVVIDNDEVSVRVNNLPVHEFKADGTSQMQQAKITKKANILGMEITSDDTHINCDYIGGV